MPGRKRNADSLYEALPTTERLLIPALLKLYSRTFELDDLSSDLSGNEDLVARFTAVIRAYNLQSTKHARHASGPALGQQQSSQLIYLYHTLATSDLDQDMLKLFNYYTFSVHSEMASSLIERSIRRRINPQVVPHENAHAQALFENENDEGGAPVINPGIFAGSNQNQAPAIDAFMYRTPPPSPGR